MKGREILRYGLLGFVALSLAVAGFKSLSAGLQNEPPSSEMPAELPPVAPGLRSGGPEVSSPGTAVVYYFYTNTRCHSCKTIEAYTRETVASRLAAGYKGWEVEFRGVNLEEKENERFIEEYSLESKAVVVQKFVRGKPLNWSRLDKIWTLLGDKSAFMEYVAGETYKVLDKNER